MSEVDISKLKPGDEVLVRMRVWAVEGSAIVVTTSSDDMYLGIFAQDIHSILPRPIKVGDRVSLLGGKPVGTVLAIHKDRAWVDCGPCWDTYRLSALEHADD